jgi:hypothetical protein
VQVADDDRTDKKAPTVIDVYAASDFRSAFSWRAM